MLERKWLRPILLFDIRTYTQNGFQLSEFSNQIATTTAEQKRNHHFDPERVPNQPRRTEPRRPRQTEPTCPEKGFQAAVGASTNKGKPYPDFHSPGVPL